MSMLSIDQCDLDEFRSVVEVPTELGEYPYADSVAHGAVVYDSAGLRPQLADPVAARSIRAEIADVLHDGPGIVVFRAAFEPEVVRPVTDAFFAMIADQHARGIASGDHYAKPGANDRVWNAIEKLAVTDPGAFVDYYSNDMLALAAVSWLGPHYQISSQVNCVNPGGEAQRPHRDYHIGFMTDPVASEYPAHAHRLSAALTLQGAVAHCEMPVESGPTLYLPHSQKYELGYLAWRRPEFIDYFAEHRVQVPLRTGDVVFFNPALFHAAGSNRTADVRRIANLLQISSAMGRTMETIDTTRMTLAVYDALVAARAGGLADHRVDHVVTACSEGYAFPTNLDRDPPLGGLTPPAPSDTLRRALAEGWPVDRLAGALADHADRRRSH